MDKRIRKPLQTVYLVPYATEDFAGPSQVAVFRSARKAKEFAGEEHAVIGPIPVGDGRLHNLY